MKKCPYKKVEPDIRFVRARLCEKGFFRLSDVARHLGVNPALVTRALQGYNWSRPVADKIAALIDLPTPEVFPVYADQKEGRAA